MTISDEDLAFEEANKELLKRREENRSLNDIPKNEYTLPVIKLIKEDTTELLKLAKSSLQLHICQFCGSKQELDDSIILRCYRYEFPIPEYICNCELAKADLIQKKIQKEKDEKLEKLENFKSYVVSKLPKRFKECSFESYNGREKEVKEFLELSKTETGLFIIGSVGTGKTHLAISFIKKHLSFCYKNGNEKTFMFGDLQFIIDSYFEDKSNFDFAKNVQILLIDDLGTEQLKEWGYSKLYELINYRYNEELQTVITSNLTIQELQNKIGDRTLSRILEMTKKFEIKGEDYRIKGLKKDL